RAGREERLPLVAHLDELRRRIMVSLAALVVAFIALYIVRDWLIDVLARPLPAEYESKIATFSPTEPFFTTIKVVFWASILAALPVWLYQVYAFIVPAVSDQSRKVSLSVVGGLSGLFVGGVAFGYFVVLPVALRFLLGFGDDTFNVQLRASDHFGFVTTMLLASGLLFEVPVAMLAFARLGLVTARIYRQQWRVALVVIAVFAALLPGGDPVSMFLLMVPQVILYILGIWLASVFGGPPVWEKSTWSADEEPGATA
ncbi:MAG: twin-arginine translocase subunit TatC, partial [Actinomycetota bacterium]